MKPFKTFSMYLTLRKRILFMLALLGRVPHRRSYSHAWYRCRTRSKQFFTRQSGTVFGFLDLFSGGNFRRLTIFALGIMPYITASIILQLLTVVWPYLEKLSKEGELGPPQDHDLHPLSDRCVWPPFSPPVSPSRCSARVSSSSIPASVSS